MNVEGKLHAKFEAQQISETFVKREFVVEISENPIYPQYVTFQLIQARVSIIDSFNVGDPIAVTFNLRGREYTTHQGEKKYFNTLEAWRIEKVEAGATPAAAAQPAYDMADISGESADDLPF